MSSRRVGRCCDIAELRKPAQKKMPAPMFHCIDGAADDERTLRRNTAAFDAVESKRAADIGATADSDASLVRRVGASWAT